MPKLPPCPQVRQRNNKQDALAMKYQCLRGHVFLYPAKYVWDDPKNNSNTIETCCCPVCAFTDNLIEVHIEEIVEPEPEITSVKSVDLSQVDDYLKLGYVVRELYAKTATLVKTEASQA
jgi:hypothetical protein